MRRTETTTIRGREFEVQAMGGMRGTLLFYRLSGAIIPALMRLGSGLGLLEKIESLGDAQVGELVKLAPSLGEAAVVLFEKMPEAELERLMRELFASVLVKPMDGSPKQPLLPILDEELAGEAGAVFQLLGFALRVNFGNFMPGLVAQARSLNAAAAKAKPNPSSSEA